MKKLYILLLFLSLNLLAFGATETLRPNAAGDETNIPAQEPNSTYHWDKVDEVTTDNDTTMVRSDDTKDRDLYNLPAHSGAGPINNITVYVRCRCESGYGGDAYIAIKTGATAYEGAIINLTSTYVLYNKVWTTNPQSGVAWTWSDIDNLQIGVALCGDWDAEVEVPVPANCTQVYVVVDYVPYSDIGLRIRTSTATIKIGTQALDGHKLRIRKGATIYGIPLIAPGGANDSGVRIWDGANIKSLPKVD